MAGCRKCGNMPQKNDKVIWKCNYCDKNYPVFISNVLKVLEKQKVGNTNGTLKCKECGNFLDDGNEKIYWKCSCGNIQEGHLKDFTEIEENNLVKSNMESEKEGLLCVNCGKKSPFGSWFCAHCGTRFNFNYVNSRMIKSKKRIRTGIMIAAAILMGLFVMNSIQSSNLKKELLRDWSTVKGENGVYILCILDFSEDEIEYRLETEYSWMDTTVDTFPYKVISGNKIKVNTYGDNWKTVTVTFNKEKTIMTLEPALIRIANKEQWFHVD